jgi:hypothetical protein
MTNIWQPPDATEAHRVDVIEHTDSGGARRTA